jgi:hypothetical protein
MPSYRSISTLAVPIGALGSWAFMYRVGQNNPSALLIILFTLWVLAPFAVMASVSLISKRWSPRARNSFDLLTLILTVASLLVYGAAAFGALRTRPALVFLVVPLISLLALGVATLVSLDTTGFNAEPAPGTDPPACHDPC